MPRKICSLTENWKEPKGFLRTSGARNYMLRARSAWRQRTDLRMGRPRIEIQEQMFELPIRRSFLC